MKKKFLCLALALAMLLSLVACGGNNNTPPADDTQAPADTQTPDTPDDTQTPDEPETVSYKDASRDDAEIYDAVFGDFYEAYQAAAAEQDVPTRYAMMAVAEAKMLEAAVMMPKIANGGGYAITRIVPYSGATVLWGHDEYRYYTRLVTNELIKSEDIAALRALYGEVKGTGTYLDQARAYLDEHGYTLKDTYTDITRFNDDPATWDILSTSQQASSEFICKTVSNPIEYDVEGTMQPNLAESWEVSDDGLTVTLHIREGLQWVDSQGRKVADLVADDWVAGMQHMVDAAGGLEFLVDGVIVGATEYINQETTDFSTVGVSAPDDHTVVYTLVQPAPYFMTMMNYSVFAPMSRSYYESQGGKFGADYDTTAADYNYGKTPDNIAYCGPYLITNFTSKNTMVFQANPTYWDAEHVNLKTMTFIYDGGEDPLKAYNEVMAGNVDATGLGTSALERAKADIVEGTDKSVFDTYHYQSTTDATVFVGFMNLNRQAFANANDNTKAISPQTDDQKERAHAAMLNQHFRMALCTGLDRGQFQAQRVGDELKFAALINSYTPGTFVSLGSDVTIDINGTSKTYPAGTNYGVILQDQITADGYPMTVYDPAAADGAGASSGFDGWYNLDYAKSEFAKAVEELTAQGMEITPENPIVIDYPHATNAEVWINTANVLQQCWEDMGGGLLKINLVPCADQTEWYQCGYYPESGKDMNFDYIDVSGWGPDYGDPSTYLNTLLPDGAGYMAKSFGLY